MTGQHLAPDFRGPIEGTDEMNANRSRPLKELATLLRATALNWQNDRAPRLGAALAFYMALSLAPSVVIILAVAGSVFGSEAAQSRLILLTQGLVGNAGAEIVQTVIAGANRPASGKSATLLGLFILFFGATSMVHELRDSLNTIWRVPQDSTSGRFRSMFNMVGDRFGSVAMVLGAGLFLLASLILHAGINVTFKYLNWTRVPPEALSRAVGELVSFLVVTLLFALVFKFLPKVQLKWRDVTMGAIFTALLFTAGKFLLGVYLRKTTFISSYGTAGSLIVLLVWVYYSAQVFYLGAEFTREYTYRFGSMAGAHLSLPTPNR